MSSFVRELIYTIPLCFIFNCCCGVCVSYLFIYFSFWLSGISPIYRNAQPTSFALGYEKI